MSAGIADFAARCDMELGEGKIILVVGIVEGGVGEPLRLRFTDEGGVGSTA